MHFWGKILEKVTKHLKTYTNAYHIPFLLRRALPQAPFPQQKCICFVKHVNNYQQNTKIVKNAQNVIFLLRRALPQAPFAQQKCTFLVKNVNNCQKMTKITKMLKMYDMS